MTRKDYERAARLVQAIAREIGDDTAEQRACTYTVGMAFVRFFSDAPAFDAGRFLDACKLGANVKQRNPKTPYEESEDSE